MIVNSENNMFISILYGKRAAQ